MLQFNRRVEYALGIVAHLACADPEALHSARSIATATHIPFDMVAKCLQRLHKAELCTAVQGKHGGYRLTTDPADVTLGQFIGIIFEPVAIAECLSQPSEADCALLAQCHLRDAMSRLNQRIQDMLESMSLAEFLGISAQRSSEA